MGENYRQYISLTGTERVQQQQGCLAWKSSWSSWAQHSAFGKAALPHLQRLRDQEQQGPSSAP